MGRVTATDRRAVLLATAGLALTAGCASSSGAVAHPVRSPSAAAPALPAQLTHGPRDRPRVALTFHGAGDPATARTLLTEAATLIGGGAGGRGTLANAGGRNGARLDQALLRAERAGRAMLAPS
jgi:hypothetical protein